MMSTFMTTCVAMETECAAKDREIRDLKNQLARVVFLYGDAAIKLDATKKTKNVDYSACGGTTSKQYKCQFIDDDKDSVISVSGSEASVFDDDESVLAPNDYEFIQVKRHTFSELPINVHSYDEAHEVEEEEVFQDARAKAPTTYNKAKYESACRTCLCGGKTSSIKSRAKIHESSAFHQEYLVHIEMSSIE